MFGIGGTELIIILLFAFIVVGPDKLPEVAKTIGKAIAKFRETQDEMNEVIKKETDAIKKEAEKAQHKQKVAEYQAKTAAEKEAAEAQVVESVDDDPRPAARVVRKEEVAAEVTDEPKKPLSFSERKAAYERQRAEKAKAEAAAAEKEGE